MKIHANSAGLALGGLLALWHAAWAVLVAGGMAQPFLNFVYSIHFLNNPFVVGPFSLTTSLTLIVVTFVVGYALGWVFAMIWNRVHKG